MASLFVANTSKKHNEFVFRLPGITQTRRYVIPAGRQVEVLKNAQREEIDYVIAQHEPYGLVHESQIQKICKFSGTVYSIDKPVKVNSIEVALEKNAQILEQEGHEQRKIAAVAMNNSFAETLKDSKLKPQTEMTLEIEEIPVEETDKRPMMTERIKVGNKK